jgi:hypothetical protein
MKANQMSDDMQLLVGRRFQLWDYSPSFSRLLIRSPQTEQNPLNIDIIFWGVDYLNIASHLGEITMQIEEIDDRHKKFLIHSNGQTYTIEAKLYKIMTSDMEIFDSPLNTI